MRWFQVAELNQFGNAQPSRSPDPAHCAQCEVMLTDALDRTLSPEDQAIFDRHLAVCPECSRMFIDARLGADLLRKLHKARPEPSTDLLAKILSSTGPMARQEDISTAAQKISMSFGALQTTQVEGVPAAYGTAPYSGGKVLPFRRRIATAFQLTSLRHTLMQPRLAMTAAMAFFSIALTLNLTGVRITQLRASDFTPSSIKRSFYDTNARVVRSIDNLRVVYELESRVRDLQRESDSSTSSGPQSSPAPVQNAPSGDQQREQNLKQQQQNQQKRSNPRQRSGSSRSLGLDSSRVLSASLTPPDSSPEPGQEKRHDFVIVTPTILNPLEQGGQA